MSRRGSPRIIMVSTDREFLNPHEYDEYSASTARSLKWCRSVAFIVISLSIVEQMVQIILHKDHCNNGFEFLCAVHGTADFTAYSSSHS